MPVGTGRRVVGHQIITTPICVLLLEAVRLPLCNGLMSTAARWRNAAPTLAFVNVRSGPVAHPNTWEGRELRRTAT